MNAGATAPGGAAFLSAMAAVLPADALCVDRDVMTAYAQDRSVWPPPGTPLALARPRDTAEVSAIMRLATAYAVPVVVRGAGSGLSGGSTAVDGCLILSTERMRDIHVDERDRVATVQPGLLNAEVKAAVAQHGLWYPPDPASYEFCSIGGNVATNAGGLCCVKYGVTADYVLGLTVVLADGRVVSLGGSRVKDVAGLPLTKLFVGSEGILGVVTEIILRLIPAAERPATLIATFADMDAAVAAIVGISVVQRMSMMELMDQVTVNAVEDMTRMGLDRTVAAMLVIQSDAPGAQAMAEITRAEGVCTACSAVECYTTGDPDDGEAFVVARRLAVPAMEKKGSMLLEDAGVPLSSLKALMQGIARIAGDCAVTIGVIAHAGDGNTHPMIMFDRSDPPSTTRARDAFDRVMELTISLGGTISGEHGIGRVKRPWLGEQLTPATMELTRAIKQAFDPDGILNPGVLVD